MRANTAKKVSALVLAIALLCAISLPFCLLAIGSGHFCATCECLVCQAIRAVFRNFSRVYRAAPGAWGTVAAICALSALFCAVFGVVVCDLVSLKVKLSN